MTQISGYNIVGCPHCGAPYSTSAYTFLNNMAHEQWTDGVKRGSLMPHFEAMRLCTACNQLFHFHETTRLGFIHRSNAEDTVELPIPPPQHWLESAWRALFGDPAPRTTTAQKAHVPEFIEPVPADDTQAWLDRIVAQGPENVPNGLEFECELRMRLWRRGNDWYRPRFIEARKNRSPLPPPFIVSRDQVANLVRLVELFQDERAGRHDRLLIVDALRQLSEFELAQKALGRIHDTRGDRWYLQLLIDQRMPHVGLFP